MLYCYHLFNVISVNQNNKMKIDNHHIASSVLVLFFQLFNTCIAQKVGVASDTALACWIAAGDYNFGCCPTESLDRNMISKYGNGSARVNTTVSDNDPTSVTRCQCMSIPFLQTFATCLRDRASTFSPIQDGFTFFYRQCLYNADRIYSIGDLEDMFFHATNYINTDDYCMELASIFEQDSSVCSPANKMNYIKEATQKAGTTQKLLKVPITIPNSVFDTKYRAACASKIQYRLGSVYGTIMLCYWALAVLIASIYRFIQQMYPEILMANNATINVIRKYLVLPATFRRHRSRPVKLLLNFYICAPTRGQSLLLLGYFILTIVFLSVNYDTYDSNPMLPGYQNQVLKYMGSRTGIIAFTQLPLVIIFGSRNNPLIWSTGWSYDTFQIYHRWTARVMMIMVVIHSACFIAISIIGHTWTFRWEHIINWRFGNMATYAGIIMILTAINRFRAKFYEYFFFIHKLFFIIFMIGIFRHCWDFGWMPWVYAAIVLYCSERLFRLTKAFVSGMKNQAYAEVYPDEVVRLSVKYSKRWPVMPGQYCYVRFLWKNMFWQAHPFSVYRSADEHVTTLQFCIAPQNGATKTISDYLKEQPSKSALMPVMIEGPYGVHQDLDKFDTVMLLAGGLGITAIYSYAIHLKQYGLRYKGQKVLFIWIIANTNALEWFSEELLSLMSDDRFEIQIYVTRDDIKDSIHNVDSYVLEDDEEGSTWKETTDMENNSSIVYEEGVCEDEKMQIHDHYKQQKANRTSLPNRVKNKYCGGMTNNSNNLSSKKMEVNSNSNSNNSTLVSSSGASSPTNNAVSPTASIIPRAHPYGPLYHELKRNSAGNTMSTDSCTRMVEIPRPPINSVFQYPETALEPSSELNQLDSAVSLSNISHLNHVKEHDPSVSMDSVLSLKENMLHSSVALVQKHYVQHNVYSNPKLGQSMIHVLPAQRLRSQFSHLLSDKRPNIKEEIAKCLQNNTSGPSSAYSHSYNLPGEAEFWGKKMERKINIKNCFSSSKDLPLTETKRAPSHKPFGIPTKPIGKSLAIISCGPPALVDNIRASIVDQLEETEGRVEYFEEAFSW